MNQPPIETEPGRDLLLKVREGMKVIARDGKELGKVDQVYLGGDPGDHREQEGGLAATSTSGYPVPGVIFGSNPDATLPGADIPQVKRDRMIQSGFLKVESAGLFTEDFFVTPDMLETVSDHILLRVSKDDLKED